MALNTLKTGTPFEDGDSVLKLLRGVSRPEIELGVGFHSDFCGELGWELDFRRYTVLKKSPAMAGC